VLLEELDTVPDLVHYLKCKEDFLQQPGIVVSVPGEEELLARYMTTIRGGQHALPFAPKGIDFIALPEGDWDTYASSPQRAAKRKADQISYLWDALIEHHSSFIRSGTALTLPEQMPDQVNHERIMRALAEQNRLARRDLSEHLHYALSRSDAGRMFARIRMTGTPPNRAFVFLTGPRPEGMSYDAYRASRMHALTVYCHGVKEGMPTLQEAIGIASEPLSEDGASQEFMHVDLSGEMSEHERRHWRKLADELNILRPKTTVMLHRGKVQEFPVPF
jgi:hypothetical protein